MKIGIIRCRMTEDYCPGTSDFKAIRERSGVFADVPNSAYYADAVKWAVAQGITNGKANGLFGSNDPCTRAQIVTFLFRTYQGK